MAIFRPVVDIQGRFSLNFQTL